MSRKTKLDKYDYGILEILQMNATISNKDLAREIGLSPPATLVRVKHLKSKGYLKKASYQLNWSRLGFDSHIHMYCVVDTSKKKEFLKFIDSCPRILSSYELREPEEFLVYHETTPYILFAVFKDLTETHDVKRKVFAEKEFIVSIRALRVHEKRRSTLPIPLHGN